MAALVRSQMNDEVRSLKLGSRECRAVFCGPPSGLLEEVFLALTSEGKLLSATMPDGQELQYPVVLQVDRLKPGQVPAGPTQSGYCEFHELASLRNDRSVGVFLTLVPPGGQASDTHDSTRKSFGVGSVANEGGAPISAWWNDPFIQQLVESSIGAAEESQLEQARKLVFEAIVAADAAFQHEVGRTGPWSVLVRLAELKASALDLDKRISLGAGYPPSADGRIDAAHKISILGALVERFEKAHLSAAIEQFKEQAPKAGVTSVELDEFLVHLRRCEVVTALKRSMPYYYAPDDVALPPGWWRELTLQRWEALLEDETAQSTPEIEVVCANPLAFQMKGIVPVVHSRARIQVRVPVGLEGEVRVVRDAPGGAAARREWVVPITDEIVLEDDGIPPHRSPIRYVAEVVGVNGAKKGSVKLVSLASWEPGLIVCSRTAAKGKLPKLAAGKHFETTLEMSGAGRHYLDVYASPGVEMTSLEASAHSEDELLPAPISKIQDGEYGLEVEAGSERYYQIHYTRPGSLKPETLRINLLADDDAAEECGSYFEFHLARNAKRDGSKLPRTVHASTQARNAQLQGWILARPALDRSFYPFVLAPDYANHWHRRDWTSPEDVIFSGGHFLNDPRPSMEEMKPPGAFVEARRLVAARVGGEDGNDLIESADLGKLLASDDEFAEAVGVYVRSYLEWLSSSPAEASWCDIGLVMGLESDGETFEQLPNAIVVSPLHPVRFAWQCLAQRTMYYASRKQPCPAASIMDPDCVPDSLALPLRDATGAVNEVVYFSVECSSDYWGILWNTQRLDRLNSLAATAPLDREMGLLVGGISSGFSVSQVHRAMDDVCEMLVAKPVIGVLVSSAAGQNNACNEGLVSWGRARFAPDEWQATSASAFGASEVHIFDDRGDDARPGDAEISNLAEDSNNAVQWYAGAGQSGEHDIAIIAQLETSNQSAQRSKQTSPIGFGGLVRCRIREQQSGGKGQFLSESRVARAAQVTGDGLADNLASAIAALEGLADAPSVYLFAPSVGAVKKSLEKAEFAAVSSSAVDPACFLGNWLEDTYLWDYELPSYSGRSGDSNGYYLLSGIKELDMAIMKVVLQRLPGCDALLEQELKEIVQEVARRGIPTVRGLSSGNSGAAGDLGLFIATRLIQDCFRISGEHRGILRPWEELEGEHRISLVIPVDPFQRYLDDLARAIKKPTLHRPDLLVVTLVITDSAVRCKITPVEVKNRSGIAVMPSKDRLAALEQAKSLSSLLISLRDNFANDAEMLMWQLAYQNLLCSIVGYGFRVYSQHLSEGGKAAGWAELHARVMEAILSQAIDLEIDNKGRLVVIDGSIDSGARDTDGDAFVETIEVSQADAAMIVRGLPQALYTAMAASIGDWGFMPSELGSVPAIPASSVREDSSEYEAKVQPSSRPGNTVLVEATPDKIASVSSSLDEPKLESGQSGGLTLRVGTTIDAFQTRVCHLNLGDTALNQLNMGVVGDLGTGKTQLLQSIIYQIAAGAAGNRGVTPNILIFDYKKDYSSEEFVRATGARVIRPQHIPLNLFDLSGSSQSVAPWLDRYRFFSDALEKIYSGIGAVQRERLKTAIKSAYLDVAGAGYPTIYDVHRKYQEALKGSDSITGILGDMVDMELFSQSPKEILPPKDFLSGVVVIALNELGQDDRTKNMLVAMILNVFYEHMLKIPKRPFVGTDPKLRVVDSMLLVDEADNIMKYEFDVLRKLLLQGREFGVGVILASQYLSHFKVGATDYREPLLSWFVHKVPNLKAAELSSLGLSEASALQQLAERIKTLNVHQCLYKTHDVGGEFIHGAPFFRRDEWS